MGGFFAVVIVAFVIYTKIREAMKQVDQSRDARFQRSEPDRAEVPGGESFSLQQVLAEIQKVKDQAGTGTSGGAVTAREQIRAQLEARRQEQKRREIQRASKKLQGVGRDAGPTATSAGPMGRRDEHPDGTAEQVSAPSAAVEEPYAAPEQASGSQAVGAAATPRFTTSGLRDATVWREILSPPVSMRED